MKTQKRHEIAALIESPPPHITLWLCYGPDEAGARATADALLSRFLPGNDPMARVDLSPQSLRDDPARLADEAAAISMFGGPRAIRVAQVRDAPGDNVRDAVSALLEAPAAENPAVLIAGDIKDSSALVKLVAGTKTGAALRHFLPQGREAEAIVRQLCDAAGLDPDEEAVAALAALALVSRDLAEREIEKLALYVDAASGARRPLGREALNAVTIGFAEADFSALVSAVVGGDTEAAAAEHDRIAATRAEVPALRALGRRFARLADLGRAVATGRAPRDVVDGEGQRIFWKEKPAFVRELSIWRVHEAERALGKLREAEIALKSSRAAPPGLLAGQVVMEIARQARRASARL